MHINVFLELLASPHHFSGFPSRFCEADSTVNISNTGIVLYIISTGTVIILYVKTKLFVKIHLNFVLQPVFIIPCLIVPSLLSHCRDPVRQSIIQ
jgi:hypothetical protein